MIIQEKSPSPLCVHSCTIGFGRAANRASKVQILTEVYNDRRSFVTEMKHCRRGMSCSRAHENAATRTKCPNGGILISGRSPTHQQERTRLYRRHTRGKPNRQGCLQKPSRVQCRHRGRRQRGRRPNRIRRKCTFSLDKLFRVSNGYSRGSLAATLSQSTRVQNAFR